MISGVPLTPVVVSCLDLASARGDLKELMMAGESRAPTSEPTMAAPVGVVTLLKESSL